MEHPFLYFAFLMCSLNIIAQERINKPIPMVNEISRGSLLEEITGWSYSLDGRWISQDMTIPKRILYKQKTQEKSPQTELGIDNIKNLHLHEIYYDQDTLMLLVKLYEDGFYKFPRTRSGWKSQTSLFYFIFPKPKIGLEELQDSSSHQLKFKLVDSGEIKDVSKKKYLEPIESKMNLMYSSNKYLHLDLQLWRTENILRFNLYSNHEVFSDLEGTVTDLKIKGKSLFGTEQLMNYIYFETELTTFAQLNIL
jgi:hypothetical protein